MNSTPDPSSVPRPRSAWPLAGRAAVGLALLVGIIVSRRLDLPALGAAVRGVDPRLLAAAAGGFVLLMALKSWRWTLLLRAAGLDYGLAASFRSYLAAFALGILTPGRLGELARAVQVRADLKADLQPCLRSVVADRLFDLLFLGAFGPVALWAVLTHHPATVWLGVAFLALYAVGVLAAREAGRLLERGRRRGRLLDWTAGCLGEAARDLTGPSGFAGSLLTALAYAVYFWASQWLFFSLGIALGYGEVACVTGCLSLVLLLPISVAGVGPREGTLIFLLAGYGIPREQALAYSLLQLAVFTLFGGLLGSAALAVRSRRGAPKVWHPLPRSLPPVPHERGTPSRTGLRPPLPRRKLAPRSEG